MVRFQQAKPKMQRIMSVGSAEVTSQRSSSSKGQRPGLKASRSEDKPDSIASTGGVNSSSETSSVARQSASSRFPTHQTVRKN